MTSKNLFFNLMKENTKQRLWTVALISLILFFALPVQTALLISSYLSKERIDAVWERDVQGIEQIKQQLQERFLEWTSISSGMLVFLFVVFAIVCGISGFAYLHSKKKTDFFHSIPVRREKLFAVVYLNGFLYTAVPYLIFLLISCVMIQVKTGQVFPWGEVLAAYCMHMAFYLLIYAVVITAVMMTGNTIVSVLGTSVFFLWGPGSVLLFLGYHSSYYLTFCGSMEKFTKLMERTSPAAWYICAASAPDRAAGMALWAAAAAALITAAGVFLYKWRPSEAAGRAMAFRKSQPVIKLLLVVPFALTGSLLFKEMMRSDGWSIFGLVCGLVVTYCIIEIIYNFDFKRLFAHKRQFALCALCAAAVLAFFRFDVSGYDSYVPSESKMEAAGIYCYRMDADFLDDYMAEPKLESDRGYRYVNWKHKSSEEMVREMKLSDISSVIEIGRWGVSETETAKKELHGSKGNRWYYYSGETDGEVKNEVIIAYHLKNGKTVLRSYYINLSSVRDSLDRVYDSEEYKDSVYPVLAQQSTDIAGINYQEYNDYRHVNLKDEDVKARILETYQRELRSLTAETRRKENPVAAIQFKTAEMQKIIDVLRKENRDYSAFNRKFYYPIYPSFTGTIELLRECGINAGEFLTAGNVEKIVMEAYVSEEEERMLPEATEEAVYAQQSRNKTITVTDKEEIRKILESAVSGELNCTNYLNEVYTGIYMTAYVPIKQGKPEEESDFAVETETRDSFGEEEKMNRDYNMYDLDFDYDKMPEFVKKTFKLTEDTMKDNVVKGY